MPMTPHAPLSALNPHSAERLFADDTLRVANAVDASKQLAFDVSAVTTGTTRTLGVPDASGTIALLERTGQTFTKAVAFALGLTVSGAALSLDRTATLDAGASAGYYKAVDSANAQGVLFGVAAGHAYAFNYNSAAGLSHFYVGNSHANNTGGIYFYTAGKQRLVIDSAGNISTLDVNAGGGRSFVVANTSATTGTYSQASVASNDGSVVLQKDCTASGGSSYLYASGTGTFSIYTSSNTTLARPSSCCSRALRCCQAWRSASRSGFKADGLRLMAASPDRRPPTTASPGLAHASGSLAIAGGALVPASRRH